MHFYETERDCSVSFWLLSSVWKASLILLFTKFVPSLIFQHVE